ncbi:MAG: hypothetical protein K2W82_14505 [Candidatus Obscuribacterales bacterium]|nr:hypothetical protein [Candidatus Obscuribacterales bacterium]
MSNAFAIGTMVWCDSQEESSEFPSAFLVDSWTIDFQMIYWRASVVLFTSARRWNPDTRLICFTNRASFLPAVIAKDYRELGVEIVELSGSCLPPRENYERFRNNFNKLEIIQWIAQTKTPLLFLDSDCLVLTPLAEIFARAEEYGAVYYDYMPWNESLSNGLSVRDLKQMLSSLEHNSEVYYFCGGEFWAMKVDYAAKILPALSALLEANKQWLAQDSKHFYTEEHVLTAINALYPGAGFGRRFIRRIWVNHPKPLLGAARSDLGLCVWHLPNQKGKGLDLIYYLYRGFGDAAFLGSCVGVPRHSLWATVMIGAIIGWRFFRSPRLLVKRFCKRFRAS